jgi:hypothetical protein
MTRPIERSLEKLREERKHVEIFAMGFLFPSLGFVSGEPSWLREAIIHLSGN